MGTIRNGGNGAFSGKAGSFIGSRWRDINYIKGLPRISTKPKTQKQLEQQAKFAKAISFLLPVKSQLRIGFGKVRQGRATGFNMAIKHVLDYAITGAFPDFEIDYPEVAFAKGSLAPPAGVTITPEAGSLALTWSTQTNKLNKFIDDELTVLVYDPVSHNYAIGPDDVLRSAGAADVSLESEWVGREVHVYMYFITRDGKEISNSLYTGPVTVI